MNKSTLENLTDLELLRYVDRSDPAVAELAYRLERALNQIELLDPTESELTTE